MVDVEVVRGSESVYMTEEAGNVEAEDEDAALRTKAAERIKEVGVMDGKSYIGASRHMRWASCSFAWTRYEWRVRDEPHCEAFGGCLDDTAKPAAASSFRREMSLSRPGLWVPVDVNIEGLRID
jgi:hypothetical protein